MLHEYSNNARSDFGCDLISFILCSSASEGFLKKTGCRAYTVICVTSGTGTAVMPDKTQCTLQKDDVLVFTSPCDITVISVGNLGFCAVSFSGADAPLCLECTRLSQRFNGKRENRRATSFVYSIMSGCADYIDGCEGKPNKLCVNAYLMSALAALCGGVRGHERKPATEIVSDAMNYIESSYMFPLTVSSVASHFGLERSYFYRVFKEASGVSPSVYLRRVRIKKAQELLCSTCDTLAKISADIGFSDVYHFSKVFKKESGISPSEYRKMNRHL